MVKLTMNDGHVLEMDDEVATLLAETQNDDGSFRPRPRIVVAKTASSPLYKQSWCWAMVILIVVVIVLFTTDSFEVNITLKGIDAKSKKASTAPSAPAAAANNNNNNAIAPPPTTVTGNEPQPSSPVAPAETPAEVKPTEAPVSAAPPPTEAAAPVAPAPVPAPTEAPVVVPVKEPEKQIAPTSSDGKSPANFPFRYLGRPLDAAKKAELAKKWGQWSLTDTKPRPSRESFCGAFPHCDVPRDKFPANAWQTDTEFLKSFLTQAEELVTRAQEAILAEYGQSKFDLPGKSLEERSTNFQLSVRKLGEEGSNEHAPGRREYIDTGGWTTPRSFQGLVRRLLHAVMTQDSFTFVMGGHSAAAAHGNLFKQSYTMQFHKAMEPVLGRLGVKLDSYNMGQGGLGTIQNSMAMGSLYGNEIDFCMWDSGMTEGGSNHYDVYARQALISGNRVPILWTGASDILETMHNLADVDVGGVGSGMKGIPEVVSEEQALTIPWAARYLACNNEAKNLCGANRYNATCWIERPDVTPPSKQIVDTKGRASWHPGFRTHQLEGRVLAFTLLMALQDGISKWKAAENFALPDSAWHVTDYYQNIRDKLAVLNTTACFGDTNLPSPRICNTVIKGVSEFTPRFRPEQTSIRSIMKDTTYIPPETPNVYEGRDVDNPRLDPPEGEINYLDIIENDDKPASRRRLLALRGSDDVEQQPPAEQQWIDRSYNNQIEIPADQTHRALEGLPIGRGWSHDLKAGDKHCNGTWDSQCGRGAADACLLYGHNDGRGGLIFDSFSGWMVVKFTMKEGIIFIKFDTWYPADGAALTKGWTSENNGATRRDLSERIAPERRLGDCPALLFEYSINGKITSLTKDEFYAQKKQVQRVVETLTLLDDPAYTGGKEVDVELGIRIRGCEHVATFHLTHIYWA